MSLSNDEMVYFLMALSAIVFHSPLQLDFTAMPPMSKLKKEKISMPVDNMLFTCDMILANTLVQSFQDDWCQTVFILSNNALVAFCGVVTILCGLRMSVQLGS